MLTPKDWHFSTTILDTDYVDMPYLVSMPGVLACTLTFNDDSTTEGNAAACRDCALDRQRRDMECCNRHRTGIEP